MALVHLKEIAYDNTAILTEMSRKALIAKADAEGNIFTETYLKKDDVAVIDLPDDYIGGTLSPTNFNILISNVLNQLYLNKVYYKLAYKDSNIRRYAAELLDVYGNTQTIDVSLSNRNWEYKAIGNQALIAHINNTAVHTTQAEKNYWNNKITCDKQGETLILTTENI